MKFYEWNEMIFKNKNKYNRQNKWENKKQRNIVKIGNCHQLRADDKWTQLKFFCNYIQYNENVQNVFALVNSKIW